jgi:hypothetical protein
MLIFDVPREPKLAGLRVASLGSCRARNPVIALGRQQAVRIRGSLDVPTHTAAEALQCVRFISGALSIPEIINHYIFATQDAPSTSQIVQLTDGGVDACLLEVSDHKQFSFEGFRLQQNFVSTRLVQPHRGALLSWYRQVCQRGAADEAAVETALDKLRQGGYRHDAEMARLLRGVTLQSLTLDEVTADIAAVAAAVARKMVVVGAFQVPGEHGAVMDARSALNAQLEVAAAHAGALYFDVSALIAEYGRERSLDHGGADIYEFAEGFMPIVGAAYISRLRMVTQSSSAPSGAPSPAASACAQGEAGTGDQQSGLPTVQGAEAFSREVADRCKAALRRLETADAINAELLSLHRGRLDALGLRESGLYEHYRALADRGVIVGARERTALDLIECHLPAYHGVTVLRAGLGELAFLIASEGAKVTAVEPDRNRRAAVAAGEELLVEAGLIRPGLLTVVDSLDSADGVGANALAVGLDATFTRGPVPGDPWLSLLRGFQALLIDPRLFLWLRETPHEQQEAATSLATLGFTRRRSYPAERLVWFRRPDTEMLH